MSDDPATESTLTDPMVAIMPESGRSASRKVLLAVGLLLVGLLIGLIAVAALQNWWQDESVEETQGPGEEPEGETMAPGESKPPSPDDYTSNWKWMLDQVRYMVSHKRAGGPSSVATTQGVSNRGDSHHASNKKEISRRKTKKARGAYRRKAYETALTLYSEAIELDRRNAEAHAGIGDVYYQQQKFQMAVDYHKKAIELAPRNSRYYESLGLDYYKLGQRDKAIEQWEKALEFAENDKDRRRLEEKIRKTANPDERPQPDEEAPENEADSEKEDGEFPEAPSTKELETQKGEGEDGAPVEEVNENEDDVE